MPYRSTLCSFFAFTASFAIGCTATHEDGASDDSAATAASVTLARDYEGSLGGQTILLHLDHQDGAVTGRWNNEGDASTPGQPVLAGTMSGNQLTLSETILDTGAPSATWAVTLGPAGLTGTATKTDGTALPLELTPILPGMNVFEQTSIELVVPYTGTDGPKAYDYCSLYATELVVSGLVDPAVEDAINAALMPGPVHLDAQGKCTGAENDRTTYSGAVLNSHGFLTVQAMWGRATGDEDNVWTHEYFNFNLLTGARYTAKDLFAAGTNAALRAIVLGHITGDFGLTADEKARKLEDFNARWPEGTELDLETVQFGVFGQGGIQIDMTGLYDPTTPSSLVTNYALTWTELQPILSPTFPYPQVIFSP